MVWGAVTYSGVGKLHILRGKIDAAPYIDVHDTSYLATVAESGLDLTKVIFQQDNAPIHTAKATKRWLSEHRVQTLVWPPCSPDQSIIENLWDYVEKRLRKIQPAAQTVEQHTRNIEMAWYATPVEYVQALYDSIPRRLEALRANHGRYTKY